jgi:hypothetical protein
MNIPENLPAAARLRAGGLSWEAIGLELRLAGETIRRWPKRYPGAWKAEYRESLAELGDTCRGEGLTHLRKLVREVEGAAAVAAATRLEEIGSRLGTTLDEMGSDTPEDLARRVKELTPDDFDRFIAILEAD